MAVHKLMFWISDKGIQTFRIRNNVYELNRYQGNDYFPKSDLKSFFDSDWFNDISSIGEDDNIDFCFLSEIPIVLPEFQYGMESRSSWSKEDIMTFCEKYTEVENYKVLTADGNSFVCQTGNIYGRNQITEMYLRCIPEFSMDEHKTKDEIPEEETSVLYRYYKGLLAKL